MKILDCTLRDGGYYTNWDFDPTLVENYLRSINKLPIEYLEVGYRSPFQKVYKGQFFFLPQYLMERLKSFTEKKLVIILNEKDVMREQVVDLLKPCLGIISMVRIAIDPIHFSRALGLAAEIKKMGFEVGFNVMYMSTWNKNKEMLHQLPEVRGLADYFYMVDSFGGVYPENVKDIFNLIKSKVDVKIGFHGHNNLELALINTLTAIDCGAEIVDSTISGMGRGAGNLKTELLLTALNGKSDLEVDFNALSSVVDGFSKLQREYDWGTNLPYMVSGANSLPQNKVMDWVTKRFYSFNSIIRALNNQSKGLQDNMEFPNFEPNKMADKVLIIGGGKLATNHAEAIRQLIIKEKNTIIIHVSSKNVKPYADLENRQIHCLIGNEGHRLEAIYYNLKSKNRIAVLPPFPRIMGSYIPTFFKNKSYQLTNINFVEGNNESVTAIAIQIALDLKAKKIMFAGYDGYNLNLTQHELELFNENQKLFSKLKTYPCSLVSLTPTKYNITEVSVYSLL
jgi:4-hydroxy 2-oxovalerate aldolase